MRHYRTAVIIGFISLLLVSSAFAFYRTSVRDVSLQRAKLSSVLSASEQRKDYGKKIEAIKAGSTKLIALSSERGTNVDYEIELTDHDLTRLMGEVASTYSGGMFFLEEAVVESTSAGITVTMKGFKLGAPTP
ncbi:MAG TPA: hypothetical protein PLT09_00910 [Deltaproteobacteria bacterium]|nr:hypothetical protein [Deltaproteobacteria bacterium]HPR53831.1 hypothetical protein [Deltaproteobacteria bacterium]HXK45969.1 hypothetical protein [Deltaproteobacteria bacterium]